MRREHGGRKAPEFISGKKSVHKRGNLKGPIAGKGRIVTFDRSKEIRFGASGVMVEGAAETWIPPTVEEFQKYGG